ncbi:MAG TPA: flagellar hook protein FlgE, partial [Mycobacterium sp.]|nr:flagellar hook protein FlgE [Mycobacterium sp.]
MMRSMFAGVSGLRSHQVMMDVVGNNIANVNTVGFKSSRVLFQDALSQMIRGASVGSGEATAGINPQQVGLGVRVASTDLIFSQGGSQLTGRATDVSIQGDGFFIVRLGPEVVYSRAGAFSFDTNGFLTDATGGILQGWMSDDTGQISTTTPVDNIRIPLGQTNEPVATEIVSVGGNLAVDADPADPPIITAIDVIDNLGASHRITFEFTKSGDNAWDVDVLDPDGNSIGTQSMAFDPATGALTTPASGAPPSFTFTPANGAAALTFDVDFHGQNGAAGVTQYGGASDIAALSQNGNTSGFLRAFAISDDGVLSGVFSNGRSKPLAKIGMANFNNPGGLVKAGDSRYRSSNASGQALIGEAGTGGRGALS